MIESVENKVVYVIGNVAVFNFPYRFFQPDDLSLILSGTSGDQTLVRNQDYTVQVLDDYANGADITLTLDPLPAGKKLAIVRRMPVTQDLDLPEYGKLPSIGLENQLDKIIMICQEFKEELSRCIKVSIASGVDPDEFLANFLSTITSAKDVALNASVAAANSAATASGELAIIGQIMAQLTGDDRYRTHTFDILAEAWQAKGAIEDAAVAALGDISERQDLAIAAVNQAVTESKEAAASSIEDGIEDAISDANTRITAHVNAAIGADAVFSAALATANSNLNATVASTLASMTSVTSEYVDSARSSVDSAISEWSDIYSAAVSAGDSAIAGIASARVSAYGVISGQVSLASAYITSGGIQLTSMSALLSSGGMQLSSGTSQLSSMTTMLTSGGGILANCSSVLSWINTSVGQIYSSAKVAADASVSLHNLAPSAHPNGFNHDLTISGSGTPSLILQKTNGKTVHFHNGGSTFYILVETGSGGWVNTNGFTVNTSTGRVGMVSATLANPTINGGTISGTTVSGYASLSGSNILTGTLLRKRGTIDLTTRPSSQIEESLIAAQDKNGTSYAKIRTVQLTTGKVALDLMLYPNIVGSNAETFFRAVAVDSDGKATFGCPLFPGYNNGTDATASYVAGSGWTATNDGWLYLMADKNSTDDAASLFINGGLVCHSAQSQYVTAFVPVKKGDVLTSRNGATTSATINTNANRNPKKIIFYGNRAN